MTMRTIFFTFTAIFILGFHSSTTWADDFDRPAEKTTGLGVVFGEPTGFTVKHWFTPNMAFDGGLAFSFNDFVLLYGDYLIHFPGAFGNSDPVLRQMQPYIGVGGELFVSEDSSQANGHYYSSDSSVGFGIRIPLGVEWLLTRAPLGLFVELVPGVGVAPGTFGFFQGGIGARYYF